MSSWECSRIDWTAAQSVEGTTAEGVPGALEALRTSTDEDVAREAYWKVDNTVVVQGTVYDAALPTAACVVTILLSAASPIGRQYLVELLEQISGGEPVGQPELRAAINEEVRRGFGMYVALLQFGRPLERDLSADLLIQCARGDATLRDRVRYYLERAVADPTASDDMRERVAMLLDDYSTRVSQDYYRAR